MEYISKTNNYHFNGDLQPVIGGNESSYVAMRFSGTAKKSFLVFKHNKYLIIPTDSIAFFHVKHESSMIVCFDGQEYSVNYSLERIQHLLSEQQFFRLNRQHLINFDAVKEVEYYFARKLIVKLIIPVTEKLLVSKEKAKSFLRWLENR